MNILGVTPNHVSFLGLTISENLRASGLTTAALEYDLPSRGVVSTALFSYAGIEQDWKWGRIDDGR